MFVLKRDVCFQNIKYWSNDFCSPAGGTERLSSELPKGIKKRQGFFFSPFFPVLLLFHGVLALSPARALLFVEAMCREGRRLPEGRGGPLASAPTPSPPAEREDEKRKKEEEKRKKKEKERKRK